MLGKNRLMEKRLFVKINDVKKQTISSGMTLVEFIRYNHKNINNIILLNSEIVGNSYNEKYSFELIEGKDNIINDLNEKIVKYGDLSFIDYNDKENINKLTQEEVMQLLYFSHCRRKLDSLFNDKTENNYAYYCHDNDWLTEIFYRNIEDYVMTLLNIITNYVNVNSYEIDNIKILIDIIKNGALFHICDNKIKLYEIGMLKNMDDIHNKFEELISKSNKSYNLNIINNKIEIAKET